MTDRPSGDDRTPKEAATGKIKVGMISLGCAKNQVDGEVMLGFLRRETDMEIVSDERLAQVIIVNTCGFIDSAKEESIEVILETAALKQSASLQGLVVTGCLAQRYRSEIVREMPEIDAVLGIGSNHRIAEAVRLAAAGLAFSDFGENDAPLLGGERVLTTPPYTAYLKVAEGCDNRCSYCAIPLIRGSFRSRPMEAILDEAKSLAAQGVKELVLVAQDTTRYGLDLYESHQLPALLRQLAALNAIEWIRVHYAYPTGITPELLDVMLSGDKILPYFDIPIQHAAGGILHRMNRKGDRALLQTIFAAIRERMPDAVLRTSVIVGFPGETEADFEELCAFVKKIQFDRLGVFVYSREEDTPAHDFADQIPPEVARHRRDILMSIQEPIMQKRGEQRIGLDLRVLIQGRDGEWPGLVGRSYADSLDVDGGVYIALPKNSSRNHVKMPEPGDFASVRIMDARGADLFGELLCFPV